MELRNKNLGLKRSEETRQRIRDRIITDEWRMNISIGNKNRKLSEENKEKAKNLLLKYGVSDFNSVFNNKNLEVAKKNTHIKNG